MFQYPARNEQWMKFKWKFKWKLEAEDVIMKNRWFNLKLINKLSVPITSFPPALSFSIHLSLFVYMQVVLPKSNQQGKKGFQNQKVNLMVNLEHTLKEVEIAWTFGAEDFGI